MGLILPAMRVLDNFSLDEKSRPFPCFSQGYATLRDYVDQYFYCFS